MSDPNAKFEEVIRVLKLREARVKEREILLGILEIEYGDDFPSGDILIKVKRGKIVAREHIGNAVDIHACCEFDPKGSSAK